MPNNSNNNGSNNLEIKSDSLILPNPEFVDSKYTVDRLQNVELPDDSLADTDLRDHDFIDNLMYVYYGSHNRNGGSYGSEIIIIGSVLSCAAQLLTIFCALLKKKSNGRKEIRKMFLHLMGCLCFSNLVFMLGIYVSPTWRLLFHPLLFFSVFRQQKTPLDAKSLRWFFTICIF